MSLCWVLSYKQIKYNIIIKKKGFTQKSMQDYLLEAIH